MDINQICFKYLVFSPVVFLRRERVFHFLRQLNQSQWASKQELKTIQEDRLTNVIRHIDLPRLSKGSSFLIKDLNSLPFITKSDLQNLSLKLAGNSVRGRLTKKTTSGSTGQPVTVWKTPDAMAQDRAANWRGYGWAGVQIGDRQGRFWGVPITEKDRIRAKIIDFITNRRRYSAFSFTDKDMEEYTARLNHFKPRYLYGYVSMLAAYAEFLKSTEKRLNFELSAVICTSEVLTSYHRQLFQDVFGARVYNEYGCGEFGTIAHECEKGSMHINAENMIVEILNGDAPCAPGELGEVVITELNNMAMPLIRYRVGDFASLSAGDCECGRSLPVLGNVVGRAYDMVYNREGKMFHGEFFMYMFEEIKRKGLGVGAFQVIQENYENFTIKIQTENGYGAEAEQLIKDRVQHAYGDYAKINFLRVDKIEREKSGKMRLVVGFRG
jgi:phenylacetate-CoA ligase